MDSTTTISSQIPSHSSFTIIPPFDTITYAVNKASLNKQNVAANVQLHTKVSEFESWALVMLKWEKIFIIFSSLSR
jgi:hypothetical protein